MSLRIETPMALARPVEATAEKAQELARQGLNAPAMKREEADQAERKLQRAQAAQEAEGRRVQTEERHGEQPAREEERRQDPAPEETPEERLERLKRRAAQRLLGLSVEPSRRDKLEERRLDITL